MPGYDVERFVNISENEKSELTCSICHEIFNKPVVANCCLQAFCEDCIHDWLSNQQNCPFDRSSLTIADLRPPLRLLVNLLGKLEIKCLFANKGCPEVILLENLEKHEESCKFNIVLCLRCECPVRRGHNCFLELIASRKRLTEKVDVLKAEKESLCKANEETIEKLVQQFDELNERKNNSEESYVQRINELKSTNENLEKDFNELKQKFEDDINCFKTEKDSLMKTIEQLKKSAVRNQRSSSLSRTLSNSSMSLNIQNLRDILDESRRYMKRPIIVERNASISQEMANKILDIICHELANCDTMFNICKNIVFKMDIEFGSSWSCLVNSKNSAQDFSQCCSFIKVKFGTVIFKVFRSKYLDIYVLKRRMRQGKIRHAIKVLESNMSHSMKERVEKLTFNAIDICDTLKSIAIEIQKSMESEFEGQWQTIAYSFGDECIHKRKDKFIRFEIAELKIIVFQTQ